MTISFIKIILTNIAQYNGKYNISIKFTIMSARLLLALMKWTAMFTKYLMY